jgi:hypothetical protein
MSDKTRKAIAAREAAKRPPPKPRKTSTKTEKVEPPA